MFHLHHLTPQHDAVARRWPEVPVVAHLHGTELKLLEAIASGPMLAATLGTTLAGMPTCRRRWCSTRPTSTTTSGPC